MSWTTTDKLLLSATLPSEASQARLRALISERGDKVDWARAVERARAFYVAPLLRFNLARADLLERAPEAAQKALAAESRAWAARHMVYTHRALALIEELNARTIAALPLKGAALMLGGYYPAAGLRVAADLDLLIDPARVMEAEAAAEEQGFIELASHLRKAARAAQRLTHKRRHLPTRCDASGVILELHYRAFHNPRAGRDFGFAEMVGRATRRTVNGSTLLFPATEDLCLHLIHHTVIEIYSAHAIARTLADLHYIFQAEPQTRERLITRAEEFGLHRATELTLKALSIVEEATLAELDALADGINPRADERDAALLLDTALAAWDINLAETGRLFEYLDFRQPPRAILNNLRMLVSPSGDESSRGEDRPRTRSAVGRWMSYPRRVCHLLRQFNWAGLAPRHLRRVIRLHRLTHEK